MARGRRGANGNGNGNGHAQAAPRHPAEPLIEEIVEFEGQLRAIREKIRDIYTRAKDAGHLKGALRIVVKRRLEDEEQRLSREAIEAEADAIMAAIGLDGTPLGEAAARRERQAPLKEATPYELGQRAYQFGEDAGRNPFPAGAAENEAWRDGWLAAFGAGREAKNGGAAEPPGAPA